MCERLFWLDPLRFLRHLQVTFLQWQYRVFQLSAGQVQKFQRKFYSTSSPLAEHPASCEPMSWQSKKSGCGDYTLNSSQFPIEICSTSSLFSARSSESSCLAPNYSISSLCRNRILYLNILYSSISIHWISSCPVAANLSLPCLSCLWTLDWELWRSAAIECHQLLLQNVRKPFRFFRWAGVAWHHGSRWRTLFEPAHSIIWNVRSYVSGHKLWQLALPGVSCRGQEIQSPKHC